MFALFGLGLQELVALAVLAAVVVGISFVLSLRKKPPSVGE